MTTEADFDRLQGLRRLDPALRSVAMSLPAYEFLSQTIAAERRTGDVRSAARVSGIDSSGVSIEHRRIVGPLGDPLLVRVYRSVVSGPLPVVIYAHGGGFVTGTLDTDHPSCIELARNAQCAVVSVDYRLAPENHCPAALDDVEAAFYDAIQHAEDLQFDRDRVAVMGRDAGAALIAGLVHRVFDADGPHIALQVLHQPMLDCDMTVSRREFHRTPGLNGLAVSRGWGHYLGPAPVSGRSVPAYRANLEGLPHAFISCAEIDPCRDEAIEYASRLLAAHVHTELHVVSATFHGFDSVVPDWEISRDVRRLHAQFLSRSFAAI
jgi:acetyl esterase